MRRTLFHNGRKIEFHLEQFKRSEDLKSWEQVPEIENFAKLPPQLYVEEPREQYLKKNGAFKVLRGKDFHTGLKKTNYPNLYHGNILEKQRKGKRAKSEILVFFSGGFKMMRIGYFNNYQVNPYLRPQLDDAFMALMRR